MELSEMCSKCFLSLSLLPLWQELVKHTHQAADKSNLNIALSAMKVSAMLMVIAL